MNLPATQSDNLIIPPYLKKGDKVAIVSPAGKVKGEFIDQGISALQQKGFEVITGEHARDSYGVFAGMDSERANDLQKVLDDDEIKAIFFSRGGYGSLRAHMLINWERFMKRPKWLVGFSDITVFHSYLILNRIASVHGVMPSFFIKDGRPTDSFERTVRMLMGELPDYRISPNSLNRYGSAEGKLIGGNISVLLSLRGTLLDALMQGGILFIEDIGEYYYHLDRMMMNLKAGKILQNISGLVVGHFTGMKKSDSDYGKTVREIIRDAVEAYDYPVIFGFPAGHELPNYPLMMGKRVWVESSPESCSLNFNLPD